MSVSVIVAVDNRPQILTHFFDKLLPALESHDDEIIIVSDACWDLRVLKDLKKLVRNNRSIRLCVLKEKVGYGGACNIGAKEARNDILLFINTDVFPEPDSVKIMSDRLISDPEIGVVQGLLIYPQTARVQSTGHIFSEYLNFHALEGRESNDPLVQRSQDRQALTSAFYVIRKELFQKFGGFDEFFFNAWEGMELTLRISHSGLRCVYIPEARALHVRNAARQYLTLDETQQSAYFWAKWGGRIKNDLIAILKEQLTQTVLNKKYYAINCGSTSTWKKTLHQLNLQISGSLEVTDRFKHRICLFDNLAHAVLLNPLPILFFTDHYEQLGGNQAWFKGRNSVDDLVIDLRGNVMTVSDLVK